MIQLYFLSILCNGISGYILFAGDESGAEQKSIILYNNPTFHLVLGILSGVTGVLKILSPSIGGFPIIGDLIPAAAGIIAGFMLIFGIYRKDSPSSNQTAGSLDVLGSSLLRFRKPVGLGLLVVAAVHFLFPEALFL